MLDVRRLETGGHLRVAIVVPRYGHTAVDRNRLKRRLRELARVRLLPTAATGDLLLRAKRETYDASFDALHDAVAQLAQSLATTAAPADAS